jgi:hypothetical protein
MFCRSKEGPGTGHQVAKLGLQVASRAVGNLRKWCPMARQLLRILGIGMLFVGFCGIPLGCLYRGADSGSPAQSREEEQGSRIIATILILGGGSTAVAGATAWYLADRKGNSS